MKKLLVAVLALSTVSAFAGKSMVKLDGCFDGQCDTLDFGMSNDDQDNKVETQKIALNYAYAFTGNFAAGLTYVSKNNVTDGDVQAVGDKYNTIGLNFYYNLDGAFEDSCFAALHYNMTTNEDTAAATDTGDKQTAIVLEYGHRFALGKLAGVHWNWSPSVTYSMNTTDANADGTDDVKTNTLAINVANFAVTF